MTEEQIKEFVGAFKEVKEKEVSVPKIMMHGSMLMKEDYVKREEKFPGRYLKWNQIPRDVFQFDAFVKVGGSTQRIFESYVDPRTLREFPVEERKENSGRIKEENKKKLSEFREQARSGASGIVRLEKKDIDKCRRKESIYARM